MSSQLTILVVDDEAQVALATAYVLRGEDVHVAGSGAEALELCRARSFDLILLDVLMPKMSGMRVYEALRELGTGLHERVVFVTGWNADAAQLDGSVQRPVLTKPFKLEALRRVLDQCRAEKARDLSGSLPRGG